MNKGPQSLKTSTSLKKRTKTSKKNTKPVTTPKRRVNTSKNKSSQAVINRLFDTDDVTSGSNLKFGSNLKIKTKKTIHSSDSSDSSDSSTDLLKSDESYLLPSLLDSITVVNNNNNNNNNTSFSGLVSTFFSSLSGTIQNLTNHALPSTNPQSQTSTEFKNSTLQSQSHHSTQISQILSTLKRQKNPISRPTRHLSTSNAATKTATHDSLSDPNTPMVLGKLYSVGQEVEGFHVDTAVVYPSLSLAVYTFTHKRSKAQFVHVERDDTDNAFCVGFRTMPRDDSGVAHILEHTVLCGSKKYPVRDPFFLLIRKSFATFMNAMTRAEATYYPFSTQNEQDFHNLLDVYLDAVFFPLIREKDFKQEGHRIEPVGLFKDDEAGEDEGEEEEEGGSDEAGEAKSESDEKKKTEDGDDNEIPQKFEFKGVVFNEMKGDISDPRSWLFGRVSRHLHTTSIYRNNSGGDPVAIPNLSHEQLVDFHATHYHPGNSIFMTYGHRAPVLDKVNKVIEDKLSELKTQYPDQCQDSNYGENDFPPKLTSDSAVDMVKNSKRFKKPFCVVEPGPTASLEDKERPYKASMTWLCRDGYITDITNPSLMNIDGLDVNELESTVDFTGIVDEGAEIQGDNNDEIASPEQIVEDLNVIKGIMDKAKEPQLKNTKLKQKGVKNVQEWYDAQIADEIINGEVLYKTKVDDFKSQFGLESTEEIDEFIASTAPELPELIPKPTKAKNYLTSDPELYNIIQRIKKLSPEQQASLNLQFEQSSLSILSSLLFDNTYSPLYTLLSDPSLGSSPSPTTGCDTWEYTPSFSMGFNGIKKGQVDQVMSKLFVALEEIAETGQGINASTLGAILHQWELSLKDHKKEFGVNMLQRLISPFAHNQDIQHGFQIIDLLPLYKHVIQTSGSIYFRTLIKYHLLSNPHRLTYIMTPDPDLSNKLKKKEQNLLEEKTQSWSDEDKLKCKSEAIELKAYQDAEVDDSCLPSVKVADIHPSIRTYRYTTYPLGGQVHIPVPIAAGGDDSYDMGEYQDQFSPQVLRTQRKLQRSNRKQFESIDVLQGSDRMICSSINEEVLTNVDSKKRTDGDDNIDDIDDIDDLLSPSTVSIVAKQTNKSLSRPVTFNIQPTNGIVIIRALINDVGKRFTPYQLSLLPFLNLLFGRIGAGGKSYKDHSHAIDQTAADFSVQFSTDDLRLVDPDGNVTYTSTLQASIKGKCLAGNVEKMCGLLVESLTSPDYTDHVYNILAQYSGGLQSAVEESSAKYAMLDAQSRLDGYPDGKKQNLISGLPHVQATTALFKKISAHMNGTDAQAEDLDGKDVDGSEGEVEASQDADGEDADGEVVAEETTTEPKQVKPSPHMMRLANDIAETMRCLILGPASQQFTYVHADQNHASTIGGTESVSLSNANYFGPTAFSPDAKVSNEIKSIKKKLLPSQDHIDYEKHQHDAVYPNPHVQVKEQYPLTFPFGFDRVLVTCDENTVNNPGHKEQILNGVSHLINGVYTAQPITYKPENSLLAYEDDGQADGADDQEESTQNGGKVAVLKTEKVKTAQNKSTTKVKPLSATRNQFTSPDGTVINLNETIFKDNDNNTTASDWIKSLRPDPKTPPQRQFNYISAPVQVNSVVYCEHTPITHLHPDFGVMQLLCEIVNERFLHTEIREKGGAYGRFASHDRNGIFTMGSIRDPQCTRTVDVFKRALGWLGGEKEVQDGEGSDESKPTEKNDKNQFNYSQQDLDEAKISLFGSIDAPESAGNRGLSPWLRNADPNQRQKLRDSMLNCTLADIQRCAKAHLNFQNAQISVVGKNEVPDEITEASNEPNGKWNITLLDMEPAPEGSGGDGEEEEDE